MRKAIAVKHTLDLRTDQLAAARSLIATLREQLDNCGQSNVILREQFLLAGQAGDVYRQQNEKNATKAAEWEHKAVVRGRQRNALGVAMVLIVGALIVTK